MRPFSHIRLRTVAVGAALLGWTVAAWGIGTPTLVAPSNSSTTVELTASLRWNADPNATLYAVQLATAQTFAVSSIVLDTVVGVQWGEAVQSLPFPSLLNKTRYYWRVSSRTADDSSAWSLIWNFTTIVDTPAVPLLQSPSDGARSISVGPTPFTWTASIDASAYRLQVGTDPGFTSLVVNDSAVTGTSKQVSGLQHGTRYYWRMNARNAGGTSDFSAVRTFSTKLPTPSPLAPAVNAVNQPIRMTLRWGTTAGAAAYRVQLSTGSTFASVLLDETQAADSLVLPVLANKTKYFWRVSARSAEGDTSTYASPAWSFTTIVDTPSVPVMSVPANGSGSIPVNPTTFSWVASTDASAYRLQVADDSLFQNLLVNDSAVTTTTRQVSGLAPNGRYYWRVQARNLAATSAFPDGARFTTKPPAPILSAPALNATNIPVTPLLDWTPVDGAVSYRVQLSTGTTFAQLLLDVQTTGDSLAAGPLVNKTKHYWRVSSRNARGDTSAFPTSAWSFTTIVGDVTVPQLQSPVEGGMSIPVNQAAFSWSSVPDAAAYRLQIALDSAFGALVFNDSAITTTSKQVSGFQYAARYYWRVSAKNAAGTGPFSDSRTFTTQLPAPAAVAPTSGAQGQSVQPVLRWTRPPTAVSYRIQVSKSTQFRTGTQEVTTTADSVVVGPLGNDSVYYWRVSARNAEGDTSVYPGTPLSFRTRLATPVLNSPAHAAAEQPVNPTLSWLSTPGASAYRLQVSDDPAFPGTVLFDDAGITATSRQVGPLSTGKTYYWRVNARNAAGTSVSLWSAIRSLTTLIDTPAVPIPAWPPDGARDITLLPTFQWGSSPGAGYYGLHIATDSLFQSTVQEYSPLLSTSVTVGPLSSNTRYFWRIWAMNGAGSARSAYSPVRSFTTILEVPTLPVLRTPASRSFAQPVTPLFSWSSVVSAETYRLQVSTDSYFPTTIIDTTGIRDTSYQLGTTGGGLPRLVHNTTYYWRIKAINRLDSSGFTLPFNFTTRIAVPLLQAPADGSANQSPAQMVFSWEPVAGARSYGFRLATDSLFQAVVLDRPLLAGTTTTAESLAVSTRYYWRVTAHSDSNGVTDSPVWKFTTLVTVPGVPVLLSPPDGSVNLPTTVSLQWAPSIGANSYRLQVATDSNFSSVLYDYPSLTGLVQQIQSLAYSTVYYWRVNASNGNGPSAYSAVRRFTVTVPPPAVPFLTGPADGAVDVNLPVVLTWGTTSGATSYRVRISSRADFTVVVYDTITTQPLCEVGGIAPGARYYWQVTAQNPGGVNVSAVWSFSTRISLPAQPLLTAPVDGAINVPLAPTLSWTGAAGSSSYHVQVARDSAFGWLVVNDSTVAEATYSTASLSGFTPYYWRVRGRNFSGFGAFSQGWTFRTVVETPVPVLPEHAAMHQGPRVLFRWHPVEHPAVYRIQIARDPAFSVLDIDAAIAGDTLYLSTPLAGFTRYYWRVAARSLDASSTSAYSEPRFFTTILDSPEILAPPPEALEQPVFLTFRWRRVPAAESYRLEIALDDAFVVPAFTDSTLRDTVHTVGPLDGMRDHWWRLRAQNPADNSEYTTARRFATAIGTPGLLAPADRELYAPVAPVLRWSPVTGAARYRVLVARDSLFAEMVLDDSLVALPERSVGPLERSALYFWKVRAKSADGMSIGAWSPVWSFTVVPPPPSPTSLVAPPHAAVGQPRSPALRWRRVPQATAYVLQIGTDSLFASMVVNDSAITDTTCQPAPLEGLTRYYWRVRAVNPGGSSAPTAVWTFTTILATPEPVAPQADASDQPVSIRFVWSSVPRASTYRLQVSTDSLFRSFVLNDSTLVDTSRSVSPLARSTRYFWRVRAVSAGGTSASPWSQERSLTTVMDPPATPLLVSPSQGAKSIPTAAGLVWQRAARAARYQVQVAADSLFEFIVAADTAVTDTTTLVDSLEHFAVYHWRVRASNVGGVSPYSSRRQFTTTLAAPALLAPQDRSTNHPVSLALQWSAVAGASRYRLTLSADSLLRSPLVNDSMITATSRVVSGLSYAATYYWRVQARSVDGSSLSAPTPIRRFATVVEKPPVPLPAWPAYRAEGQPTTIALRWTAAPRATRYHLQVATDSIFVGLAVDDSTNADTARTVPGLQAHTRHWWRVAAANDGGISNFCTAWEFTTSIATPSAVSPPDNATDLGASVTLSWTPSEGASGYILELSPDSLFQTVTVRETLLVATTADVAGLEPFLTYFWRVKAIDARGEGAFSSLRRFTTRLVAPLAPVQVSPASGKASLLPLQTFRWQRTRLAERYELQIATDSPFDSIVVAETGLADTFVTVKVLAYETRYFWRVRGRNTEGPGDFSAVWSFFTAATPPQAPAPVSPRSASTDQLPFVHFSWNTTPHARRYHLQVSLDAPFASTVFNDSTLADTVSRVGPLEYTRTYYWRVRALNEDWTSAWSSVWSTSIMAAPVMFDLFQNFPNPFNPATVIRYDIPAESDVELVLYNLLGQRVRILVQETQKAGRFDVELDGTNLPSGVYFYRLTARSVGQSEGRPAPPADPFVLTRKLVIAK